MLCIYVLLYRREFICKNIIIYNVYVQLKRRERGKREKKDMKMNFIYIVLYEKFVFIDKFIQKYKTLVCRCMYGRENGMILSIVYCIVWGRGYEIDVLY